MFKELDEELMKIGILTFHWANNYGAVLQAYALFYKLKQLGHTPIMIDRRPTYQNFLKRLYHRFSFKHYYSWLNFIKQNEVLFDTTRHYYSTEELKKCVAEYNLEAIIVGSDQVWRWFMMGYNYFLDFVPLQSNIKRISYAASFGLSTFDHDDLVVRAVTELLKRFDKISVREQSGVKLCKNSFGVDADLVLDPTLLHNAEFYIEKFNLVKSKTNHLVTYFLGTRKNEYLGVAKKMSEEQNYKHKELFWVKPEVVVANQKSCGSFHLTVREWLNEIYNAEVVLTNSFHATAFSIIFNKRFFVVKSEDGGVDRLYTLLGSLNLTSRIVDNFDNVSINQNVDYSGCDVNLMALRQQSEMFIKSALLS